MLFMNLLEIISEEKKLHELIEYYAIQNDGEIPESFQEKEIELLTQKISKLDSYAYIIKQAEEKEKFFKEEKNNCFKKEKFFLNLQLRLKNFLKFFVLNGENYLQGNKYKFTLCQNGGKQPIKYDIDTESKSYLTTTNQIDKKYLKTIEILDIDKIRQDLENGVDVEFAYLEERGNHIRIS
jgi:hypothetical protein